MQQELIEGKRYRCEFPPKKESAFNGVYIGITPDQSTPHLWYSFNKCTGQEANWYQYIIDYKFPEWVFTEI